MPKIFELAKELDMNSLELVEKLKNMGFSVRNHMSVLDDADVEKAVAELKAAAVEAAPAKKKTKKKVAKKKVAKKKVAKKKVVKKATGKVDGEAEEKKEAMSKKTTKRKSVVRKKASKIQEEKEQKAAAKAAEEAAKAEEEAKTDSSTAGLQVVYDPSLERTSATAKEKDYVEEEKPHTFTPVYIPKEDESPKTSPPAPRRASPADAQAVEASGGDLKDRDKKRVGGLAAMMTKSKTVKKDMTQIRADEELKTYSMGIVGKVHYTPVGRKKQYSGPSESTKITEVKEDKRYVSIDGIATGAELAKKLKVKFKEFAGKALELNLLLKSEDYIGLQLAGELAGLYDYSVRDISFNEETIIEGEAELKKRDDTPLRSPIVTIMGHVDHGKTTLVDHIRNAKVVDSEAGGITQHIGAYQVKVKDNTLTFLDTPGHAAFGAMRQRGADVTDVVVLVVAADDGVMPQTKESIRFCQNADKPIVVAVNKMDKEDANPERVKQELMEFGITPEEWGGDTQFVNISALKGDGIDDLLETLNLVTEIMELRADPKGKAEAVVIESKLESGRGPVATVLVQKGTLKKSDSIVVGETFGRARSLMDHLGNQLQKVGPSTPVQILGLQDPASPGDVLNVVKNEREAKKIAENRTDDRKKLESVKTAKPAATLEDFFASAAESDDKKVLKLIVRADVNGSYEAIKSSLEALGNDEVAVEVIGGGVGAINDNDVILASSSSGYIIGFNMRPVTSARRLAEEQGVDVKTYSIIYELIDDVKAALEGMLDPEKIEIYIGRAQVKETFSVPKIGLIAGSSVIDGKIKKGCNIRLLREGKIVFDGKMSSLKRFKDDAKEVTNGLECGIGLENFNDIKVDDVFEAYMLEEKKRKLELNEVTQ